MAMLHGKNVVEMKEIDKDLLVVLVEREGSLHNYVTWRMNAVTGATSEGEYFSTLEAAQKSFKRRTSY